MAELTVTLLGTGTSTGVPMVGCTCRVCQSTDRRDKRLRVSALLEYGGHHVLIDTSADFRQQMLHFGIQELDAVLYTHSHYDHIGGFDDLRAFQFLARSAPQCFAAADTYQYIRRVFPYAFGDAIQTGGGLPNVPFTVIDHTPFDVMGRMIIPIPIHHGSLNIFGYRIGNFAYLTDCSAIPDSSIALLRGLEVLVLDGLRLRHHPTHLSIQESVKLAERLHPTMTYLTHMNHDVMHAEVEAELPASVRLAYDGIQFRLSDAT